MRTVVDDFTQKLDSKFKDSVDKLNIPEIVFWTEPLNVDVRAFVERDTQQEQLATAEAECIKGTYKRIIIHGVRGSGKTSLANIVMAASRKSKAVKTVPVYLSSSDYVRGVDFLYRKIIFSLCDAVVRTHLSREERKDEEAEDTAALIRDAASNIEGKVLFADVLSPPTHSIKQIIDDISKPPLITSNVPEQTTPAEILKMLMEEQLKGYFLLLILDDFHKVLAEKTKAFLQEFLQVTKIMKCFSVIVMYTNDFSKLKESNDELTKDAFIIEVPPLTIKGCKELLRRRLLIGREKESEIDKEPNYPNELLPFSESATEALANAAGGVPLLFITLLKKAKTEAENMKEAGINDKVIFKLLNSNVSEAQLTQLQKTVLDYIKSKKQVTIDEIAALINKTSAYAYYILKSLYELNILEKRRQGKFMYYSLKPIDI